MLEPASGAFDVIVAPGEGVQAAVDACPRGGSVLMLPGTHAGPVVLAADKVVHVFGRGLATLLATTESVVTSKSTTATLDGLVIRREAGADRVQGVYIKGGGLRMQACDVTSSVTSSGAVIFVSGAADPFLASCRCGQGGLTQRGAEGFGAELSHFCLMSSAVLGLPPVFAIAIRAWAFLLIRKLHISPLRLPSQGPRRAERWPLFLGCRHQGAPGGLRHRGDRDLWRLRFYGRQCRIGGLQVRG